MTTGALARSIPPYGPLIELGTWAKLRTALTLPCTVVSCERAFSKLRFANSRLRSLIGQELLESLVSTTLFS